MYCRRWVRWGGSCGWACKYTGERHLLGECPSDRQLDSQNRNTAVNRARTLAGACRRVGVGARFGVELRGKGLVEIEPGPEVRMALSALVVLKPACGVSPRAIGGLLDGRWQPRVVERKVEGGCGRKGGVVCRLGEGDRELGLLCEICWVMGEIIVQNV